MNEREAENRRLLHEALAKRGRTWGDRNEARMKKIHEKGKMTAPETAGNGAYYRGRTQGTVFLGGRSRYRSGK